MNDLEDIQRGELKPQIACLNPSISGEFRVISGDKRELEKKG